jgi:2-hydroxychromene-2-carboxylate isomerase
LNEGGGEPQTAQGPQGAPLPVFYYDFASPQAYLMAEQMPQAEWVPIRSGELPGGAAHSIAGVEQLAAGAGLQELRTPTPFPFDAEPALRAATYAATIGKVVAFSLAAFRQAYAGGRPLDDVDNVVIAAAACEIHPRAILQALERQAITDRLDAATALAAERVRSVPTIWSPA